MNTPILLMAWATVLTAAQLAPAGQLAGHQLLLTSIRTGDTEVFIVDPDTGDAFNVTRSPQSEDRYPCWSPDGKWPVWVIRPDGTDAHVVECLRFQCAIPGQKRQKNLPSAHRGLKRQGRPGR